MFYTDLSYSKYMDCASCPLYQKNIFKYRQYQKGMVIAGERSIQNTIFFLMRGEVMVNSNEYPGTVFRAGQFILQPMGTKADYHVLDTMECVLFMFERPQKVCDERYDKKVALAEGGQHLSFPHPKIMDMCPSLLIFMNGLKGYLMDDLLCSGFLKAKQTELVYLLNCYYTLKDLAAFYSPLFRINKSFEYFVLQNYKKVKDVEAFARLGGYSTPTFRRIFKDTFGEPVYQWLLKKKCEDIQNDLLNSSFSISSISEKYGFESLSNFSHFCRTNFGKSPRTLRSERKSMQGE